MLHLHILSWILAIILFIATHLNISKNQGRSPFFKPLHMILRLFMLLTLISEFWILTQSFMNDGANHVLFTLRMLYGVAIVGLMEVSVAKREKHEQSRTISWIAIALIIITMVLSVIPPLGSISELFGID